MEVINEDDSARVVAVVEVSGVDYWVEVLRTDHKMEPLVWFTKVASIPA